MMKKEEGHDRSRGDEQFKFAGTGSSAYLQFLLVRGRLTKKKKRISNRFVVFFVLYYLPTVQCASPNIVEV